MGVPFQILEHTADLRIRALGRSLPDLFAHMMRGMFSAMKPQVQRKNANNNTNITRNIKIRASDREALLVDFLNEVLYLGDIEQELYGEVTFTKLSDTELEGELVGQKREEIVLQIKAATHHGLTIEERNGMLEATMVFDI